MIGGAGLSHPYAYSVYLLDAGDLVLIDPGAGQVTPISKRYPTLRRRYLHLRRVSRFPVLFGARYFFSFMSSSGR